MNLHTLYKVGFFQKYLGQSLKIKSKKSKKVVFIILVLSLKKSKILLKEV